MGQKVNPIGFRVGVIRTWDSRWYAKGQQYIENFKEDYKLRKFIKQKLKHAGVAKIEMERAANKIKVIISTARPGVVIGKKGVEKIIELKLNSKEKKEFNYSVKAVRLLTELSANLLNKKNKK